VADERLARRYALAVFSLARERGAIDAVARDLEAIAGILARDSQTREFFVSPVVDRRDKQSALAAAFDGKIEELALHALLLLVRKRREALLGALVKEYRKLQLTAHGMEPLTIRSARRLSATQVQAMVDRLERVYSKKFDVTQVVEPELIGGVRLLMGDRRIDASVSGRLDALARTLFASN
jgi:F-type H+-transporting ATPase subunit delta